jgi:hypothetical protein
MGSSEWAAWVQAVGSVVAIVVATWIPVHQERLQRASRKKNLTHALRAYARVAERVSERAVKSLDGYVIGFRDTAAEPLTASGPLGLANDFQLSTFPVHELGDSYLIDCYFEIAEAYRTIDRVADSVFGDVPLDADELEEARDELRDLHHRLLMTRSTLSIGLD